MSAIPLVSSIKITWNINVYGRGVSTWTSGLMGGNPALSLCPP